jgi:hypothetical protein
MPPSPAVVDEPIAAILMAPTLPGCQASSVLRVGAPSGSPRWPRLNYVGLTQDLPATMSPIAPNRSPLSCKLHWHA